MSKRSFIWLICLLLIPYAATARTWTSTDGRQIEAEPYNIVGSKVILKLKNGSKHELEIARFVKEDQEFLKTWTPKRPINVPAEAQFHNGSWYHMVPDEDVTHIVASEKAKKMGGHLAWIKDKETNDLIVKIAANVKVWVDGSDEELEGKWQWSDGSAFTFKDWLKGQPNNHRGQHNMGIKNGRWEDFHKTSHHMNGFIVQWDM